MFAYIDMFGKIATISSNELSTEYGYLIDCESGIGPNKRIAEFKILVRDQNEIHGSIQYFAAADKLKINGTKVTSINSVPEFKDSVTGLFKSQLVKFTLNNEGEIKELFTATDKVNETIDGEDNPDYEADYIGYTEDEFTYDVKISKSTAFRGGDMNTFEGFKYFPNLETDIFVVPDMADPSDEDFKVYDNANIFISGKYAPGDVYAYDVDTEYNIGAIVIKVGGTVNVDDVGNSGNFAIVDSFVGGLDENGEEKTILVSAQDVNGYQERIFIEDDDIADTTGICNASYKDRKLTSLPKGSVVQYITNYKGEIAAIRILFIPTAEKSYFEYGDPRVSANYVGLLFYTSFAKVIKVTDSGRILYNGHGYEAANATAGTPEWIWDGDLSTAKRNWDRNTGASIQKPVFYLYDSADDTITTITINDILPEDDMFIVKKSVYTKMVVIYR